MAIKAVQYQIPFDDKGNLMDYPESWRGIQWCDNYEFEGALVFNHHSRGRSSATFTLTRHSGQTVSVFMKDFSEMLPHMVRGVVRGKFTFVKRGENYGCRLIEPDISASKLQLAYDAACKFIDAHVADPDLTSEMASAYAAFRDLRTELSK